MDNSLFDLFRVLLAAIVTLPYYRGDSTQISIFEKNEKLRVDFKGSVFHPMAFDILKLC